MKKFVLRTYDYLSGHRYVAWILLVAMVGFFALMASRLDYDEDISAFLPTDELSSKYSAVYQELGGQDKIAVFFEAKDTSDLDEGIGSILEAIPVFCDNFNAADSLDEIEDVQASVDEGKILQTFRFITENYPYFLQESDYRRMDSLLSVPGYLDMHMAEMKESMYSIGSGFSTFYTKSDPAGLFTPVLSRLNGMNPYSSNRVEDGYLFTPDGKTGIVFFDSPFGGSESGKNSGLKSMLESVIRQTVSECPDVRIFATGGPLVAVENSSRIKKDSFMAVAIALLLIALVLYLSFKRFSDVLWIAVTILCAALFALCVISLFKSSISIIVLGIGSMIVGIAVNYPLHYVDHLKYQPDKRKALADQINPLVVGNLTTVGAFLALLLLKADALHDFGMIASLTLVGTILFVLFFLPVFVPEARQERNTLKLNWDRFLSPSATIRKLTFVVFIVLTALFFFLSKRISFDSDMHNLNYMTAEQSKGFDILSSLASDDPGKETVYIVTEAADADDALTENDVVYRVLDSLDNDLSVSSLYDFCPSSEEQGIRLARWNSFVALHAEELSGIDAAIKKNGFAPSAFAPFDSLLAKKWTVVDASYFKPLTSTIGSSMFLDKGEGTKIIDYVKVPSERAAEFKDMIRQSVSSSSFCFSATDVSNRLVATMSEDFNSIGAICSIIVFVFLTLSFRSLELSLLSFLPLAVGWVWILGIMQLFGIQFNIVNIILATFIFGQGDDYTIFITEGLMYEHACGKKILQSFKNCVMLSALIMFIGIGSLIVARHPAMKSLAYVTVIGMSAVVVMAYYLPPLVFRWITTKKGAVRTVPVTLLQLARTVLMLTVFILAMAVLTVAVWLYFLIVPSSESKKERFHRVIQKVSALTLKCIPGTKFSSSNPYGEDFSKPAVIVCNHQSHLDILALLQLSPKIIALTNDWVWKNPFYGYIIHKADFYPISEGAESALPHLREYVEKGYSIIVFPEGTRSEDCHIQRFHRGAFLLAQQLGVDILPVYIHGFGYALPKKEMLLRRADLYVEVGKRISSNAIGEDVRAFTKAYRHEFEAVYEGIRDKKETPSYNAPFVRYQYLYKGEDAMDECRKYLTKDYFSKIDNLASDLSSVAVVGSGNGVFALLLALSRRHVQVYAYEDDEIKHLVATRCIAVPDNLHHLNSDGSDAVAEHIIMLR